MQKQLITLSVLITSILLANCSNENASWMQNSGQLIHNKKITQITLPGAHYANAYGISSKSTLCNGELLAQSISNNARIKQQLDEENSPPIKEDIFIATLNTQDNDVLHQLEHGVRYLELSICQQDNKYYTSNLYLTEELRKITKQINQFIHEHPSEIIIIDLDNNLRAEYGFMNNQDLAEFHNYLEQEFGSSLIPNDKINITIGELINEHYQIILLSSNHILNNYPNIWDKNSIAFATEPVYPTIKKISLLDAYFDNPTNYVPGKLNILPVYSDISSEVLTPEMYEDDQDQEIILNYLQHHIGTQPSIIVSSKTDIERVNQIIIDQTLNSKPLVVVSESMPITNIESQESTAIISTLIPTPALNPHINASSPKISLPK